MTMENSALEKRLPVGPLGLIALPGTEDMVKQIDAYLVAWRKERAKELGIEISGFQKDTFMIDVSLPRFSSGEGKGVINQSVRGMDLYIFVDVCNYSVEYTMQCRKNPMSPDDHYANLKRIIAAATGKTKRINVIMPFLYESRQHKRSSRESLDCAMALQELTKMGVDNIITFDAHDPRVQNAIPQQGFETIMPTYQFVKKMLKTENLVMDPEHMMVISPDEGAISRAIYFANMLGVDVGMFYKRRDYTTIVNGKNPIVAHEFLGTSVEGKTVIVVDDMIASGDSMIDVAKQLKERGADKVFACATFGLFTAGMANFDKANKEGIVDRIYTTNLTYQNPDVLRRDYYVSVNMDEYQAALVDTMNHDASIEPLLSPTEKIQKKLGELKK